MGKLILSISSDQREFQSELQSNAKGAENTSSDVQTFSSLPLYDLSIKWLMILEVNPKGIKGINCLLQQLFYFSFLTG